MPDGARAAPVMPPFPWVRLVAGCAGIIAVAMLAWEAARLYLDPTNVPTFYAVRGVVMGGMLVAFASVLIARRQRGLQQRLAVALAAERKFRELVESAPDAVLITDDRGVITIANTQAERLFGRSRADLVGLRFDVLVGNGEPAGAPSVGRRKGGAEFPAEVTRNRVEAEEGALVVHVVRDLTERVKAEQERMKARERLAELEQLKEIDKFRTQLINTAAHELRTPLTPIQLQVDLLQMPLTGPLTDRQRNAVAILGRNVERLAKLLDDILQVARLQAGRLTVKRAPTDLARLVVEAVETYQESARRAHIGLETRLAPGLMVEADPARVTQVLFNLLSNAIKFTPGGGKVVVEVAPVPPTGEDVAIKVRDTGIGLKPEDLGRLFTPFTQVHDTAQRTDPGAGLGLYISKGIVELHGGKLWAESEGPGQGTTFAFTLPRGPPAEAPAPAPEDAVQKRARELV